MMLKRLRYGMGEIDLLKIWNRFVGIILGIEFGNNVENESVER